MFIAILKILLRVQNYLLCNCLTSKPLNDPAFLTGGVKFWLPFVRIADYTD